MDGVLVSTIVDILGGGFGSAPGCICPPWTDCDGARACWGNDGIASPGLGKGWIGIQAAGTGSKAVWVRAALVSPRCVARSGWPLRAPLLDTPAGAGVLALAGLGQRMPRPLADAADRSPGRLWNLAFALAHGGSPSLVVVPIAMTLADHLAVMAVMADPFLHHNFSPVGAW